MKKNVLLVTSAAPSQSPFSTSEKRPPIGIGFLISTLKGAGHEAFFIDNYLQPSNFLETNYLERNRIHYVGIYANTICYRDTLRMLYRLEYLRKTGYWNGKLILGGPHTTVALETIPDFVDFVVQGEGEKAILDIVEERVTRRVISYPRLNHLDYLPMPAWDYFVHMPYNWGLEWWEDKPIFPMNTSRGCPFHCTFCSVKSIWGKKYTFFSAERILSEIQYLVKTYGAKGVYFREDNFTCNRERLIRFCHLMNERKMNLSWACETRANTLDRETVALMHQAGARAFYIGVESGSQRILDSLKKGITVEQIQRAFKYCHEFGIKTGASIIVGTPEETEEDLEKTFALIEEIRPTVTWPNIFVGIPRSELYDYILANPVYEFIDDRGLVYLKGHNDRVKKFYGNGWNANVPVNFDRPKISVVLSTYNDGRFISQALQSLTKQTFQDFEIIIVDDASTDNTPNILSQIHDPRIHIIVNSQNQGLTRSLNIGIRQARGEYIARMDADDISLPHRFENQLSFLERNPDYALVGSSYYVMNEQGNITSRVAVLSDDSSLKEGLKKQNWFGHGSVLLRKAIFQQVGGYDERFRFAQDYDLWIRIAEQYKIANLEEPLYCWRTTEKGISREKETEQRYFAQLALSEAERRREKKHQTERFKERPLVSVIVPTYNRPEMLAAALKSILSQTYQNFEILVVNDGEADVQNIITPLNKKGNITYVKHSQNKGLAAARNTGIKLARGKYIAYLDDDDLFYPRHVEALVAFLESGQHKVAYTDAYRAHQEKKNGEYVIIKRDVPYSFDFDYDRILETNFVPVICFMHERSCVEDVGLFDESLKRLEDWDLWIRMSRKFKFAHLKEITCEFTWRTDGTTMTSGEGYDFIEARNMIRRKYKGARSNSLPQLKFPVGAEKSLVSIVILTFNQLKYTKECVTSIRKHTPEPHEIIFVDNGSKDGTVSWLRKLVKENPRYKIIENQNNIGFARGCNQGLMAASGEYLLLLNNDVLTTEGWLSGLIRALGSSDRIGIVGPMTNHISGPQQVPKVGYSSIADLDEYARSFRRKNRYRRIPFRRIVGFCMLFRRNLVEQVGLLDESFGTGNFEDDDFCLRAELAGYRNMIAGDVFIHHFGSRSFIGNKIDYRKTMKGNQNYFLEKWNSLDPKSPEGKKYLSLRGREAAKVDYEKGQAKKAVERWLAVIRLGIEAKENYYDLADLFLDAKQYDQAFRVLEQMPDADQDERKYALLGYCQEGLNNPLEAQKLAEQALSLNPSNALALNLKGILSYRKGCKEEAQDYFQRAAAGDPGFCEPHTNLGVIRWEENRRKEALQLFERGFILSPTITDILQLYHTAVTQTGEFAGAELNFYEAKALHPFHQGIRFFLIDILLKQEKYKAAMEEIEQAMGDFGIEDEMLRAALEVRKRIGPQEKSSHDQGGRISLCMIAKDEENDLVKCLRSVKPVVDEIIVVDTGSADRTKDIATALGAKVFEFSWENDFSAARNFSISQAMGNWILVLDADEVISPLDHASLLGLTKAGSLKAGYSLVTRNYLNTPGVTQWTANNGTYDEEAGNGWIPSEKVRLFPRDRRIHFENPVHEFVEPSMERGCIPIKKCNIPVHHYGKLNDKKEKRKGEDYFLLGKKKLEKSSVDIQSLRELAVQANILKRYEEAAELWHQVIRLQPNLQEPYVNLTSIYMNLGKFQEASATSQKAIELDPKCKEAVLNYSIVEFTLGNLKNVISTLENLLSKIPEYPLAMGLLSLAYRLDGERGKSQSLAVRIKKAGFNYDEYLQNTAKNLFALGRIAEAGLLAEMMEGKVPRVQFQGASLS